MLHQHNATVPLVAAPLLPPVLGVLALQLFVSGCGAAAKCRAEVAVLREEVARLRDDVEAIKDAQQRTAAAHSRRRVKVIGEKGDVLHIDVSQHAVFVSGQVVPTADLEGHLEQIAAGTPSAQVIVTAEEGVSRERVGRVTDVIKRAGLRRITLRVRPASR